MKIIIASDHAGYELKTELIAKLKLNHEVIDCGPKNSDRVDYPDYADHAIANYLQIIKDYSPQDDTVRTTQTYCLLICGSGQGMAMRANKYQKIRASLCWNPEIAKLSREHNNANVLCLGARNLKTFEAMEIILEFQNTKFSEGRHTDRVIKLSRSLKG